MTFSGVFLRCTAGLAWLAALPAHAALPTVPTPAAEAAAPLGAGSLLQAGLGMLLVLGLIFLCAWAARRWGLQRVGGSPVVKLIASTAVGTRERVVVVEVGERWLVLGVTPSQINTLHSLPAQPVTPGAAAPLDPLGLFAQKLGAALGGTKGAAR